MSFSKKKKFLPEWVEKVRKRISHSNFFMEIVAAIAAFLIKAYSLTLKVKVNLHPQYQEIDPAKALYGFWEGRQIIFVPYFGKRNICVLIDSSWAGKVLKKILRWFGYETVIGSSKRKGVSAMIALHKKTKDGYSIAFSLDGPRGPVYKSKPGIIFLSKKTNYPIVPVATSADRAWVLKSTWCNYMIPKPFAKCIVMAGKPVYLKENDNFTTDELDNIVMEWTRKADEEVKNL